MNNKSIEKSIERAVNEAPSWDFTEIANTPFIKMTEHDYITRQSESQVSNYHKRFTSALACCLVMLLCFTGWFVQYRLPNSIITFDVNPSIAIVTNNQNQILSIKAMNEDAQKVLDGINDNSSDLDSITASIITSIINQGYLSNNKNVVMISVENKNLKKADTLALSLKQVIRDRALSHNINPQILKQTFKKDKNDAALAEQYNVSEGKLRLIKKMISTNNKYSIDLLATKSMEDLLYISKKNNIDLHEIIQYDDSITKDINDNSSDKEQNPNNTNNTSQSENYPTKNSTQQSLDFKNENQSSQSDVVNNENHSSQLGNIEIEDGSSQSGDEQDKKTSSQSDKNTSQHIISKSDNDSDSDSNTDDSDTISKDDESNDVLNNDSSLDTENNDTDSASSDGNNEEHNVVETNDVNSDSESPSDSGEDDMDSSTQSSDEYDEPDYD